MPWFAILRGLTEGLQEEGDGMEQGDGSRKGKHLTRVERIVIEQMSRGGRPHGTSRRRSVAIRGPLRGN
jgi:hypothetical protein